MRHTIKRFGAVVLMAGLLGACAASFRSDVATFHTMDDVDGGTVNLVTIDPQKAESLEYAQYATVIGQELQRIGYRVTGEEQGDFEVSFDLKISDGREKIQARWGGVNAGFFPGCLVCQRNAFFYGVGPWGFAGPNTELVARTVYHTELTVQISNAAGDRVFDGRAEADVRGNKLPETVPLLARSLFKDFPGQSGITRRVTLSPDERESIEKQSLPSRR